MKILWVSDSPTSPSGFGNVTRFVCSSLARAGHDVHILGWQNSAPGTWCGTTLHGMGRHPMGADVILRVLYRVRPDVLITLADVWWMPFLTDAALMNFFEATGTRWLTYYPIDGNLPDGTLPASWISMLERADARVAMAEYGRAVTERCGLTCSYIPHGVETTIFRPAADRIDAKHRLGYDGKFVVFSDARNQPRKMLPRLLEIFRRFAADKDDVLLHLHCDPDDPAADTKEYRYRIDADVELLGLADKVRFTRDFTIKRGLPLADLVAIYQAADVHLLTSWGEGFGLPTLQSAACGVVPLGIGYTATRDLLGDHGVPIAVADSVQDQFGIARAFVDIDDAVAKLDRLYGDRRQLAARAEASVRFAAAYDWERITPMWLDLLRGEIAAPRRRVPEGPATSVRIGGGGFSVRMTMQEQRYGEMAGLVWEDASVDRGSTRLRIPIVVTERNGTSVRDAGAVCLRSGSPAIVDALRRIFPDVAPATSLDRAVLAIDLDADDGFASACAAAGVPLVAGATEREALLEARSILTDYPLAAAMTERAPLAAASGM